MPAEIDGTDMLLSDLQRMIPSDINLKETLEAGAVPIRDRMEKNAPVGKTGNLKRAVKAGKVKKGKKGQYITIGIHRKDLVMKSPDEYYPAFVEYGHGGPHPAPPHPFIRPAYDLTQEEAAGIMRDRLLTIINFTR